MWTFRLQIHLLGGRTRELFGDEDKLKRFRKGLTDLLEAGVDEVVPYLHHSETHFVRTSQVSRVGDIDPIIPVGAVARLRTPAI